MKKLADILLTALVILFLILAVCVLVIQLLNLYEVRKEIKERQSEPELFDKTWECREQKDGDMICFKIKG